MMTAVLFLILLVILGGLVAFTLWLRHATVNPRSLALVVKIVCIVAVVGAALFTGYELFMSLVRNQTTVTAHLVATVPALNIQGLDGTTFAQIESAGEQRATFVVSGLTLVPRLLLALGALLRLAMVCVFAYGIWRLAQNVGRDRFTARASKVFMAGAVLLFAAYFVWTLADGLGSVMAAEQALTFSSMTYTGDDPAIMDAMASGDLTVLGWPVASGTIAFVSLAPLAVAVGLALIGVALAAGERLQEDVEGLV